MADTEPVTDLPTPLTWNRTPDDLADSARESLLVVILDANAAQRLIRANPEHLTHVLNSVVIFSNIHLMQRGLNRVAIIACLNHVSELLYPLPGKLSEVRLLDGQLEQFARVEQTVKQRLSYIICNSPKPKSVTENTPESRLAGAMTMALAYINRQNKRENGRELSSRILIITGSQSCITQYSTYLNVFYTGQKMDVVIDVCTLDKHLSLLQQAADITGGQYLNPKQTDGLLQYMLWVFLPDFETRHKFVLPPPERIDFRAACFCHHKLVDIGYVCSACLSIYCQFTPICRSCQTVFKFPVKKDNKKKKSNTAKRIIMLK